MTLETLPRAIFITRPSALQHLVRELKQEPIIAVDTESNSLYVYQEQVCLIQFSTPSKDFLVDPLALNNLAPLGPVFKDPKIEKVFHAAEYDLICMQRDFGFEFANLFDTMIAARVLGWPALGLGALLESEFNVLAEKRYQRANWGKRPIPHHMLAYAQLDTHYLIPLRHRLRLELNTNNLFSLANEDFARACQVKNHQPGNGGKNSTCWRVHGAHDLSPQGAAVLRELCNYRDRIARAKNRPLFKVIGDRTLLAIAQECPHSLGGLRRLPGMSERQVARHGKALLEAVARGQHADPVYPPHKPRPNNQYLARVEALRKWRKSTARKMGVQSDVILPRDLLYQLAESNPTSLDEVEDVLVDVPWRLARFGQPILKVIASSS